MVILWQRKGDFGRLALNSSGPRNSVLGDSCDKDGVEQVLRCVSLQSSQAPFSGQLNIKDKKDFFFKETHSVVNCLPVLWVFILRDLYILY